MNEPSRSFTETATARDARPALKDVHGAEFANAEARCAQVLALLELIEDQKLLAHPPPSWNARRRHGAGLALLALACRELRTLSAETRGLAEPD